MCSVLLCSCLNLYWLFVWFFCTEESFVNDTCLLCLLLVCFLLWLLWVRSWQQNYANQSIKREPSIKLLKQVTKTTIRLWSGRSWPEQNTIIWSLSQWRVNSMACDIDYYELKAHWQPVQWNEEEVYSLYWSCRDKMV